MNPLAAPCGLICSRCKAYQATQNDSDKERRRVAEDWGRKYPELFKNGLKAEQIDCDGCLSGGRIFFYCQTCQVRMCCTEKQLQNCALCEDYPCERLSKIFKLAPYAKATLDEVRNSVNDVTFYDQAEEREE